jgi:hypothetical protein
MLCKGWGRTRIAQIHHNPTPVYCRTEVQEPGIKALFEAILLIWVPALRSSPAKH